MKPQKAMTPAAIRGGHLGDGYANITPVENEIWSYTVYTY